MTAKQKPYEQFGPFILFKKLESDALGDLWRAARIDGTAAGDAVALHRLTGGSREAIAAAISVARQVAPLLTGPSFARNQVIDVVANIPFIAHEYAGGRSLRYIVDRARGGAGTTPTPIPIDQAIVIAERVALSLATIAELRFAGEKLSHGALLPQFIWITDDGEIRVAGQQLGKGLVGNGTDFARYFSPEYQHSKQSTPAAEVYSLGAILYLVVTGHEPPDGSSTSAFAASIRAAKTMAGTPVPDDIRHILEKSLNLDPAVRYATVADMKTALSALSNSGKYTATTFNLAFFLSNLLKKEFEGEVLEREKESKINIAPYVEALSAPAVETPTPVAAPHVTPSEKKKSRLPLAAAAVAVVVAIGIGAFMTLGAKKPTAAVPPVKLASTLTAPAPARQPVIPEPILSSPASQPAAAVVPATGTLDPAAQKKAFEDAVNRKLQEEMMKLQADYTRQLQKQQARNAPVPVSPVVAPPITTSTVAEAQTLTAEEQHPSAAQLDLQRQRDLGRVDTVAQQIPTPSTQAPAVQEQPAVVAPVVPQIKEGDVVDVNEVDVVPKRMRDPRVMYPPMAARQHIETNVLTSVLISENGDVIEVKVLRGDDRFGFTDAAVRALKTARYTPAMKGGKRVKTWLPQMISFKP